MRIIVGKPRDAALCQRDEIGSTVRDGQTRYTGKLCEASAQAAARDIFANDGCIHEPELAACLAQNFNRGARTRRLDDIAEDKDDWHDVVSSFWNGFKGLLEKADASSVTMKQEPIETDVVCDKCGHKMLLREGRFGKFLGCSNFPKCRNILPYNEKEERKSVGKCPNCGKNVFALRTKKGKTFYACEDRAGCNFMSWDIPTGEKCPECGNYLIRKGKTIKCSNCNYVKAEV